MAFTLETYSDARPRLFHLTARQNIDAILASRELRSAGAIFAQAGHGSEARTRRPDAKVIDLGGARTHIRDQRPLHAGNVRLPADWQFEDLVALLNAHVFFWPGAHSGPIAYGIRHFRRYRDDECVVLSVGASDLFAANAPRAPLFCAYNSGSPRCSCGRKSPRGPETFVAASAFPRGPGAVVEVVFRDHAVLPAHAVTLHEVTEFD